MTPVPTSACWRELRSVESIHACASKVGVDSIVGTVRVIGSLFYDSVTVQVNVALSPEVVKVADDDSADSNLIRLPVVPPTTIEEKAPAEATVTGRESEPLAVKTGVSV